MLFRRNPKRAGKVTRAKLPQWAPKRRLTLEVLEGRAMLAAQTFIVDSLADDGGGGLTTLREAIVLANATNTPADNGDRIVFDASIAGGTITLNGTELDTITDDLTIDGEGVITISGGASASRIFNITSVENVTLEQLDLTNGADTVGGTVYAQAGSRVTILDCNLFNNTALGGGGAILSEAARLLIRDSDITGNIANGQGGGLTVSNSRATILNSRFDNNQVTNGAGGGISVTGASNVFIGEGCSLTGNDAFGIDLGFGGGLYNEFGTTVKIVDSSVTGNTADVSGGGLANFSARMTVDNSQVNGNSARGRNADEGGGGIFSVGFGLLFIVNASQVSSNVVNQGVSAGGGIFSNSTTVTVEDSFIQSNRANASGAGVEVQDGTFILDNVLLTLNTTKNFAGDGAGLHAADGITADIFLVGCTVSANTGKNGAGLYNGSGNDMSLSNTKVINNLARGGGSTDGGGGIYNNGGNLLVLSSSEISGNTVNQGSGSGGGIFSSDGSVTIANSTITNNRARRAGGGIEVINGTIDIEDSFLTKNTADGIGAGPGNGGAIHVTASATVNLTDTEVTGNTAAEEGGGLWQSATGGTMSLTRVLVQGNTANGTTRPAGGGGGIFNNGGLLDIFFSQVNDNDSAFAGGGLLLELGGTVRIEDSLIDGNTALDNGGGLLNAATLDILDSLISDNTALAGGGIYNESTGTVNLTNVTFSGNSPDDIDNTSGGTVTGV